MGKTLARTERMGPAELEAYRLPLISKLLVHARKTTELYKHRIDFDARLPQQIAENWTRIPILTRTQAVARANGLKSRAVPPEAGPVSEAATSGSTGTPFAFKTNGASSAVERALTERMFRWWSVDPTKSLAMLALDRRNEAPPPSGRTSNGWHSASLTSIKYFLSVTCDTDTQLQWLLNRRPDYLGTYPEIMRELARAADRRGVQLSFKLLFSNGNLVDADTRALCRRAFGSEIADTYGAREASHIAAQCPDCGEYHISAETSVVDVLRADDSPAAPGEYGRVVVTSLYNYAMPLIRYELGDMAEAGTTAPACGRGLPTLRRILGRYRNLFRLRDGTARFPDVTSFRLGDFIALKQWQVVQTDFDDIEVRYVADSDDRSIDLDALTLRVRTVLRQPVRVIPHRVERIERSASGKFEDFMSLVRADRT